MIPLSILDLSVVTTGTKPAAALRNSIDLARHADALGYVRYWLAEHHNLASVASRAPDLMIGQIAAVTSRIRVGSGGVMLPNHAPLVVAERFKMLEALFPGRIDLGLGRAPGTDGATAYALRSRLDRREGDDFLERLHELILWETRDFPQNHPFTKLVRLPDDTPQPLPSVEEALAYPYPESERASIARNRSRLFVGSPATLMQKLQPMITASQADELMIITAVYDHDARKKSYSLLADAFGLGEKAAA